MIATTTPDIVIHTATVRAADGVRFSASATDDLELAPQVVQYIAARCDDVLWPAAAREVRELIAAHREADAIAAYFSNVGQRWDQEWLELSSG